MTTLLLTDREHPEVLVATPGRARTRLWARTHMHRLDRELAAGVCPDTSAALSLRAGQLIGAGSRRDISRSLRGVVTQASGPVVPYAGSVPVYRGTVLAASPSLLELADRLESPEPVDARGVARARLMLTDGGGPLYNSSDADELIAAVDDALSALEVAVEP